MSKRINEMTPAEIRQDFGALWRQATGHPAPTGPTAAEIRGDKTKQAEVIYIYIHGQPAPAAAAVTGAPAATEVESES